MVNVKQVKCLGFKIYTQVYLLLRLGVKLGLLRCRHSSSPDSRGSHTSAPSPLHFYIKIKQKEVC
jgi:hypothetical protein